MFVSSGSALFIYCRKNKKKNVFLWKNLKKKCFPMSSKQFLKRLLFQAGMRAVATEEGKHARFFILFIFFITWL